MKILHMVTLALCFLNGSELIGSNNRRNQINKKSKKITKIKPKGGTKGKPGKNTKGKNTKGKNTKGKNTKNGVGAVPMSSTPVNQNQQIQPVVTPQPVKPSENIVQPENKEVAIVKLEKKFARDFARIIQENKFNLNLDEMPTLESEIPEILDEIIAARKNAIGNIKPIDSNSVSIFSSREIKNPNTVERVNSEKELFTFIEKYYDRDMKAKFVNKRLVCILDIPDINPVNLFTNKKNAFMILQLILLQAENPYLEFVFGSTFDWKAIRNNIKTKNNFALPKSIVERMLSLCSLNPSSIKEETKKEKITVLDIETSANKNINAMAEARIERENSLPRKSKFAPVSAEEKTLNKESNKSFDKPLALQDAIEESKKKTEAKKQEDQRNIRRAAAASVRESNNKVQDKVIDLQKKIALLDEKIEKLDKLKNDNLLSEIEHKEGLDRFNADKKKLESNIKFLNNSINLQPQSDRSVKLKKLAELEDSQFEVTKQLLEGIEKQENQKKINSYYDERKKLSDELGLDFQERDNKFKLRIEGLKKKA